MDWIKELLTSGRVSSATGLGILAALALILAARLVLPDNEKQYTRGPLLLLVLHLATVVIRALLPAAAASAARTIALVGLFLLLASIGRSAFLLLIHAVFARRVARMPKIVEDMIQIGVYILVALLTLRAAGVEPGSLLATSALLTAVIGLSLQDTLGNMFAGLAIQAQRPFEVGDWIQFDQNAEHVGRVLEINWRATKIMTLDLVEVTVPNGTLAKTPIQNFTKPQRMARRSVYVTAPYAAPPARVRRILLEATRQVPGVLDTPEPDVLLYDFTERGVFYWVRFFVRDFERRDPIAAAIRERIWYSLRRAGYSVPPPQRHVEIEERSEETLEHEQRDRVEQRQTAIAGVDFLAPLPAEARRRLAELAETRLYGEGEAIIRQGQSGDELFVVETGEVSVVLDRGPGVEVVVATLGPGKFFGEMSLMTGEPRRATVRARTECEVLVVGKQEFQQIVATNERLLERISRVLSDRGGELEDVASDQAPDSVGDRQSQELLLGRIKRFFSMK